MSRSLLLLTGLVGVALLTAGCVALHGSGIESDLYDGTSAALASAGLPGVSATLDGRDVTLVGTVPTEPDRSRALAAALAVRGVRLVRDGLTAGSPEATTRVGADATGALPAGDPLRDGLAVGAAAGSAGDQLAASGDASLAPAEAALGDALAAGRIEFDSGTARLTDRSREILDRAAAVFARFPAVAADVRGYTDSEGGARGNRTLSTRRAEATRDYLAQKGVDADRLAPRGFGEADPVASNDTEDGRARNRRVVFALRPS